MRKPVESFCRDAFSPSLFFASEPDVIIAVMLWLILVMRPSLGVSTVPPRPAYRTGIQKAKEVPKTEKTQTVPGSANSGRIMGNGAGKELPGGEGIAGATMEE
jgi:hypothetical protein